jgi:hepatocyte growth factor-regulated tyrosine kinase substrate
MKNKLARIEKKESNDNSLPPFMQADPYQRRDQERSSSISKPPPTASEEEIDEDLKKAIELSLKEAERSKNAYGAGYAPPQREEKKATPPPAPVQQDEQDDPDLAAAIAASLQEMKISQNYASQSRSYRAPTSTDLSTAEMENILLFSTLMDRIRASSGEVGNDPEINALYTQIGAIQPKLVKSLDETNRKHRKYWLDMG